MTATYNIKVKELNPQFVRDLQERYPEAELEMKVHFSKMQNKVMFCRIELLPVELQQQVFDFVDFLIFRYCSEADKDELTAEQKEELLRLWEEYEQNPDDVLTPEEAEAQTNAKYGLL